MRLLDLQEATYHHEHPIFEFIKDTREKHHGYNIKKINKEEFEPLYNALTQKFGEPIFSDAERGWEPYWRWGDHAFAGTDVEVHVHWIEEDEFYTIEVETWGHGRH
jgi:hypothetical protein